MQYNKLDGIVIKLLVTSFEGIVRLHATKWEDRPLLIKLVHDVFQNVPPPML